MNQYVNSLNDDIKSLPSQITACENEVIDARKAALPKAQIDMKKLTEKILNPNNDSTIKSANDSIQKLLDLRVAGEQLRPCLSKVEECILQLNRVIPEMANTQFEIKLGVAESAPTVKRIHVDIPACKAN